MSLVINTARLSQIAALKESGKPIWTLTNKLESATVTSNLGVATDGAIANATNGTTYDFWVPDTSGETVAQLIADIGASETVNFVGLAAHNFGETDCAVTVEYSTDSGSNWTAVNVTATATDNSNVGLYFEDIDAQDWRISLTFADSADIQVGAAYLGYALTMERSFYGGFAPPVQATEVELMGNWTQGGNFVATTVTRYGKSASFEFNYLTDTFVRGAQFQELQRQFNTGRPFFFAWRPVKYPDLLYASRAGAPITPINSGGAAFMSFNAAVRAYNDD